MKTITLTDSECTLLRKVIAVSIEAFNESEKKTKLLRMIAKEMVKELEKNYSVQLDNEHKQVFERIKSLSSDEKDEDIIRLESIQMKLTVADGNTDN